MKSKCLTFQKALRVAAVRWGGDQNTQSNSAPALRSLWGPWVPATGRPSDLLVASSALAGCPSPCSHPKGK